MIVILRYQEQIWINDQYWDFKLMLKLVLKLGKRNKPRGNVNKDIKNRGHEHNKMSKSPKPCAKSHGISH